MAALWLGLKNLKLLKDWTSVILAVWVAPGALETLQKGGAPTTFGKGLRGPRGRPDPNNDRCPILKKNDWFKQAKVQLRKSPSYG